MTQDHNAKENLLPNQFSFRHQFWTKKIYYQTSLNHEQVHRIINSIKKILESKKLRSIIFLDVEKHFDKFWHKDIQKLNKILRNMSIWSHHILVINCFECNIKKNIRNLR